jgi:hypothetical protein
VWCCCSFLVQPPKLCPCPTAKMALSGQSNTLSCDGLSLSHLASHLTSYLGEWYDNRSMGSTRQNALLDMCS